MYYRCSIRKMANLFGRPAKTKDSPLTEGQQRFVDAYLASQGDLAKAIESSGCKAITARHWITTHVAVRARCGIQGDAQAKIQPRNPLTRREALVRLRSIARRPAREKINYASQIAAIELAARIEGWIHEPASPVSTTNVVVGASTADPARYDQANAAAALAGDPMPAFAGQAPVLPASPAPDPQGAKS